jgi:hypothetical protein
MVTIATAIVTTAVKYVCMSAASHLPMENVEPKTSIDMTVASNGRLCLPTLLGIGLHACFMYIQKRALHWPRSTLPGSGEYDLPVDLSAVDLPNSTGLLARVFTVTVPPSALAKSS